MNTMSFPRFSGTAVIDPSVLVSRKFSPEGQAVYTQVRDVLTKHGDYVASLPDFVKVAVTTQPLAPVECSSGYIITGQPQETVQFSYQSDFGFPVVEKFEFPLLLDKSNSKRQVEKRANNAQSIADWLDELIKTELPLRAKLFQWCDQPKEKEI